MSDPFRIFADAEAGRQETLKIVWPELYESLARLDRPAEDRLVRCAVHAAHDLDTFRKAVGRLLPDGPPACIECIAKAARRPGGFPLIREDRK